MAKLVWTQIADEWGDPSMPNGYTYRAKVPQGWLVSVWAGDEKTQRWGGGLTFIPDPKHTWEAEDAREAEG
ncbi:MAG: hypothetical protein IPM35_41180 [Myxococcales bacterium]|nr:hypothetical protein [Myxococcales bacterium]